MSSLISGKFRQVEHSWQLRETSRAFFRSRAYRVSLSRKPPGFRVRRAVRQTVGDWMVTTLRRIRRRGRRGRRRHRGALACGFGTQSELVERYCVDLPCRTDAVLVLILFHRVRGCGVPLPCRLAFVGAVFLQGGLNFLDAVGSGGGLAFTLGFLLDFEEAFFFLAVVEEVCAAPGRPAPDTTGAALTRSAAPKMESQVRLLIVVSDSSGRLTAREPERRRPDTPCRTGRCPIAAGP